MRWFAAGCPVTSDEQQWIEDSLDWLVGEFGNEVLRRPVVLPTPEFFPDTYTGTEADVHRVVGLLCRRLGVDPARLEVEFFDDGVDADLLASLPSFAGSWAGAAGHYQPRGDRAIISINSAEAANPMSLVATVAHELGHVLLLGEQRIAPERRDSEPLTDLLTVFFGYGVFSANAAFDFTAHGGGWRARRTGYLTEPMFGYALAAYAWLRGEADPDWGRHLDTNPRAYLRKGLRYLRHRG
ncbi:hypothetical protein [Micromonospora sp. NBC_01796]|uniref:hypothetical protein n=1 Tax=Micromonospora sp. NBC_01796 TaxID=2975987 RepID=UPI002DDBA109|nr:hypothetical protein [Micromonospora sp. NBC_01796]WSA88167.1 hypothetical protein OIE47_11430 [Micromonospora sp. NBC_01796]